MKNILLIYGTQTGRTLRLAQAAADGITEFSGDVHLTLKHGLEAGVDDLLQCDGLLIGTPENFGYMSGAVKDFLDRTYNACRDRRIGLPYALFVSAGNDGSGAVRAIERIATGYGWNPIADATIVVGEPQEADLGRVRELGQTLAAGLSCGVY